MKLIWQRTESFLSVEVLREIVPEFCTVVMPVHKPAINWKYSSGTTEEDTCAIMSARTKINGKIFYS